jgi:hypothetical protein
MPAARQDNQDLKGGSRGVVVVIGHLPGRAETRRLGPPWSQRR